MRLLLVVSLTACGSHAETAIDATGCTLTAETAATSTVTNGCALVDRRRRAIDGDTGMAAARVERRQRAVRIVATVDRVAIAHHADERVAIFDNQAAPGDDIFDESGSFDQCQGHPQQQGVYHYHLNLQTSTNAGTAGEMVWFLTTGTYASTPGSCTGC
jgi:hypothetical protein